MFCADVDEDAVLMGPGAPPHVVAWEFGLYGQAVMAKFSMVTTAHVSFVGEMTTAEEIEAVALRVSALGQ